MKQRTKRNHRNPGHLNRELKRIEARKLKQASRALQTAIRKQWGMA